MKLEDVDELRIINPDNGEYVIVPFDKDKYIYLRDDGRDSDEDSEKITFEELLEIVNNKEEYPKKLEIEEIKKLRKQNKELLEYNTALVNQIETLKNAILILMKGRLK